MELNIGVVGATGKVGEVFLQLMEKRNFPVKSLKLFASQQSEGLRLPFRDQKYSVESLREGCFQGLDLVFFSSGDEISKEWAPKAVQEGAFAVDNSAAFRMSPEHLLIVPEINGDHLPPANQPQLIANPNCSTIQLVVALSPLAQKFGLQDVKVATYQSVSGAGKGGQNELIQQIQAQLHGEELPPPEHFAHTMAFNSLPHIGSFNEMGFCSEEMKIMQESRKILNLPNLKISAFTVRVPTLNGHGEAVWVTLNQEASESEILHELQQMPGLQLVPQKEPNEYPHVRAASGQEPVFVGRVHRDLYDTKTWLLWVVADNLWKGAALNGLQIAEKIYDL